ncbi:olfactory receptor 5V1-like [Spea bombifrons]|uniref:olfactory receptor 5V1-like n=1 Tax=Spea bombifrons TaxID=233779 RepID=UPI00234BA2DD|nr:olfactory receptor 5V1-like [Spea bombifrons]
MVTHFIIKGISEFPELQLPIFLLVLLIYLTALGGNLTILLLVCLDRHLHTPMYFFLGNLSFLDMSSTTVTLQNPLVKFIAGHVGVSFHACMAQVYLFASITTQELLILTAMGYDRYVAICNPLRYHMVMSRNTCALLAIACWTLGFLQIIPPVFILSSFSCYRSNEVNHFFCDMVPLMRLTCSDTSLLEILNLTEGLILSTLTPFLLTFVSYVFIISSIAKIPSGVGRRKAFYTCSSHLTVVILLYLILVCQYITPLSGRFLDTNKLFSLFNTAAIPMLNPIIYSLKNKDVKSALRRRMKKLRIPS